MNTSGVAVRKYNTAILKLFEIILSLNERQQQQLLKYTKNFFKKEKRANNRQSCHIPIYYATSDRVYSSYIENIRPTGLFINAEKPLPTGEQILMAFRIEGCNKPLKVSGEIAHANQSGIGIKFKDLSPYLADKLETAVRQMKE